MFRGGKGLLFRVIPSTRALVQARDFASRNALTISSLGNTIDSSTGSCFRLDNRYVLKRNIYLHTHCRHRLETAVSYICTKNPAQRNS